MHEFHAKICVHLCVQDPLKSVKMHFLLSPKEAENKEFAQDIQEFKKNLCRKYIHFTHEILEFKKIFKNSRIQETFVHLTTS